MDFQSEPVVVRAIEGGIRVSILGPVHTNVRWLESELGKVIERKPRLVELDLSQNTFLSSTGIGLLVWLRNGVTAAGGVVRITAIPQQVLKTLKFARVNTLFEIASDAEIAGPGAS